MKLYLKGHDYKYAVEQMVFTLYPHERVEYSDAPPDGDTHAAVIGLHHGHTWVTARTALHEGGARIVKCARVRADAITDDLLRARLEQKIVKLSLYRAVVAASGSAPPWGALTGVRPVKLPTRALRAGASEAEAARNLRREYDVSPLRAQLAIDCARASLDAERTLPRGGVGLYIGIPFCPTRCAYCSFISADVRGNLALVEPYLHALHREIDAAGALAQKRGLRVTSLYIGGGTPTTLSAAQLHALLKRVNAAFDLSGCTERTVEAGRPDTIDAEKMSVLRTLGIDRVSVNPQTMDDAVLRTIGRAHTAADTLRAYELVRAAGFPVVNMDLIAGLPGETAEGFRASLEAVFALEPENITVHTLAQKRGAALDAASSGDDAARASDMLDFAWPALRARGYAPYYLYRQKFTAGPFENIGWCKSGCESAYNIAMMEELQSILSLGSGGVTKLVDRATGAIARAANPKYPKEYIAQLPTLIANKEELSWPIN